MDNTVINIKDFIWLNSLGFFFFFGEISEISGINLSLGNYIERCALGIVPDSIKLAKRFKRQTHKGQGMYRTL